MTLSNDGIGLAFSVEVRDPDEDLREESTWDDEVGLIHITRHEQDHYEHQLGWMIGHISGVLLVDFHPTNKDILASARKDDGKDVGRLLPPGHRSPFPTHWPDDNSNAQIKTGDLQPGRYVGNFLRRTSIRRQRRSCNQIMVDST